MRSFLRTRPDWESYASVADAAHLRLLARGGGGVTEPSEKRAD